MLLYLSIAILAVLIIIRVVMAYEHQLCLILLGWLQAHVERRHKPQARILHFPATPAETPPRTAKLSSRGRS